MTRLPTNRLAVLGLLLAVSIILGYIEALLPVFFPVPGAKIGLSNLLVLLILFSEDYSYKEMFFFQISRVILCSLLFGSLPGFFYSFAGMLLSTAAMLITKCVFRFEMIAVSMTGGIFHNIGQMIVAAFFISGYSMLYYLPALLCFGLAAGFCMGVLSRILLQRKIV